MYCYYLRNKKTENETCIFGYTFENAIFRSKIQIDEWEYIGRDYLD